jgi:hypothetical protein
MADILLMREKKVQMIVDSDWLIQRRSRLVERLLATNGKDRAMVTGRDSQPKTTTARRRKLIVE